MKPKLEKVLLARKFRREPTESEKIFWEAIKAKKFLGLKFRRQVVIEGFIVDFICYKYNLVIEIDGDIHKYQREYDSEREKNIKRLGYNIFKISAKEVENNIYNVLEKMRIKIHSLAPLSAK
jgi:very-short-patch-repair endonuclease